MIHCAFTGVLNADAKPRKSAAGKDWTSLNCRVGSGESTQWCSIAVFGENAAACADLKEGAAVYCEGRLELRKWQNHAGEKMSGLNVAAAVCRPIDLTARASNKPASTREIAAGSLFAPLDDPLDDIGRRP